MEELDLGRRLLQLARDSVAAHLAGASAEPPSVGKVAGVFVTLRTRSGALRGCIGSLEPARGDIGLETARSAVLAATRDPRFSPVTPDELDELVFEVSVLSPLEPIAELTDLDPSRYGVVVRDEAGRRGLLLPDIPGVVAATEQVALARRKGGISVQATISLERFEVLKFVELAP